MDDSVINPNDPNVKIAGETAAELAHIAKEIYKTSFELAEENKTLSLFRKLDKIIMGAVTNIYQITQQVADIIATDAGYQAVAIYLMEDEAQLHRVGLSKTELVIKNQDLIERQIFQNDIKSSDEHNVIAMSVRERKIQIISGFETLSSENGLDRSPDKIEENIEIKSLLIFPFKIRSKPLGAIVIGVRENREAISQFQIELAERLVDAVGIGIDNAILYQELSEANEHLKEVDKLKDEFVSLASHELRTPMTAIKSYLWMALSGEGGELNEKLRRYIQRSYNSVDRLIKLVNDMLNISRIESGRLIIHIISCNIEDLIREVLEDIGPRASELGLSLIFNHPDSMPNVLADPDKIKEVIYNLVGNSMKFTQKGGKIIVTVVEKVNMVEISIKDNGMGIAAEDLPKIFQKFGIIPGTYPPNQAVSGTGLGLYLCRSLVEMHGGKVWASSDGKGLGTTFTFTLKAFNQDDLNFFTEKYKQTPQPTTGLLNEQVK